MRTLVSTTNLTNEEWLEYRKRGIGGSDASAVAGLNPWSSPMSVWADKVSKAPPEPLESERMRIGSDLEDYVAKRFVEETGLKVRRCNSILQHEKYDFILANVDRLIVGKNEGLECKVTNSYAKADWEGDKIPIHYEIQCHHYMMVTGYEAWWIAALVGNEKVVIKKIERDEDVISRLTVIEKDFWKNYVLTEQMPAPDGSENASSLIKELYPEAEKGETIELPVNEFEPVLKRRSELVGLIDELSKEKETIDQNLQLNIGTAETAKVGDSIITWKSSTTNRLDTPRIKTELPDIYAQYLKQTSSRRFLVK